MRLEWTTSLWPGCTATLLMEPSGSGTKQTSLLPPLSRPPTIPTYFQVHQGGLLDVLTATVAVPAVGYALCRCWTLDGALIVCTLAPPLLAASIVDGDSLNVYRLGSATFLGCFWPLADAVRSVACR